MLKNKFPEHHWAKHISAVPKGFLRYWVLTLLNKSPRSGSEITEEIEKLTDGCWKPRPGSIYPLLAGLHRGGYIERAGGEQGVKRYRLTVKGKRFLEEVAEMKKQFENKKKFLAPLFFSTFSDIPNEEAVRLRSASHRFFHSLISARQGIEENFSKRTANEMVRILEETSKKLEKLTNRLGR